MDEAGEFPGEVAFCLGKRSGTFGFDDVHDGFGLCEVEAAVQEGAFREFASGCRDGAVFKDERECLTEGFHGSVDLDFDDVFSCVGVRRFHEYGKAFVDDGFVSSDDVAEAHEVWRGFGEFPAPGLKYFIGDAAGVDAADADDADAAFARACRNRCDGCFFVHVKLLSLRGFSVQCVCNIEKLYIILL